MDNQEDPEIDDAEKATRFGCGGLLGVVVGLCLALKATLNKLLRGPSLRL